MPFVDSMKLANRYIHREPSGNSRKFSRFSTSEKKTTENAAASKSAVSGGGIARRDHQPAMRAQAPP
jgi:hypothetical protein